MLELLFLAERQLLRVLENQTEEIRNGGRARSKPCALDHDSLRDGKGRSIRRIPELSQQPFCNRDGGPAERGQPTEHRDGGRGHIADPDQPVLHWGLSEDGRLHGSNLRESIHGPLLAA